MLWRTLRQNIICHTLSNTIKNIVNKIGGVITLSSAVSKIIIYTILQLCKHIVLSVDKNWRLRWRRNIGIIGSSTGIRIISSIRLICRFSFISRLRLIARLIGLSLFTSLTRISSITRIIRVSYSRSSATVSSYSSVCS